MIEQKVSVNRIEVESKITHKVINEEVVTFIYKLKEDVTRIYSTAESKDYYVLRIKGNKFNKEKMIEKLMLKRYNLSFAFNVIQERSYELGNTLIVQDQDEYKIIKIGEKLK